MPENLKHDDYWQQLDRLLTGEQLAELDFDELRTRIAGLRQELAARPLETEYSLLRIDIERRVAGMLKAMAIAQRRSSGLDTALQTIESLPALSAEELLNQQRHVSARFRDLFGGLPRLRPPERSQIAVGDYK